MITIVVTVVSVMLVLCGGLWLFQRNLIYFPDDGPLPPAGSVMPGGRDVVLNTSDGLELGAWEVPPSFGYDRGFVVLVAPGNAGHRGGRTGLASRLAEAGFTVLLVDYRGYGGNPGSPSEEGLARDVRAARSHLLTEGWAPERIIYLGESLGCAPLVALAVEHPPAGLVLRSPFEELAAVAGHHYPFLPAKLLLRDRYPVAGLIADVQVPTVVVYGSADTIVPPEQSQHVAALAGGPVEVVRVEGADHNDIVLAEGSQLIGAVVTLADRLAASEE